MRQKVLTDQVIIGTLIIANNKENYSNSKELGLLTYDNEEIPLEHNYDLGKLEKLLYSDVRVRGDIIFNFSGKKLVVTNIAASNRKSFTNVFYANFGKTKDIFSSLVPLSA